MQINVKVKIGKLGVVKGWDGNTLHAGVNAATIAAPVYRFFVWLALVLEVRTAKTNL